MTQHAAPQNCQSMEELRALIDRIDSDLVRLLALRQGCIDRASELKPGLGLPAEIPDRVADVLHKVALRAESDGLDADLAQEIWRQLIGWSIAREERMMGQSDD